MNPSPFKHFIYANLNKYGNRTGVAELIVLTWIEVQFPFLFGKEIVGETFLMGGQVEWIRITIL